MLLHFLCNVFYSQEVCHCLETLGSKSQCFDILQNGICKYLVGSCLSLFVFFPLFENRINMLYIFCVSQTKLGVIPDSLAAGLLRAMSRLLDLSVLPIEPVLRFLSQCCLSLLSLLITLQQEAPAETNHRRCVKWLQPFIYLFANDLWLIWIDFAAVIKFDNIHINIGCDLFPGRRYGGLACQRWAPFLACYGWFCSCCGS